MQLIVEDSKVFPHETSRYDLPNLINRYSYHLGIFLNIDNQFEFFLSYFVIILA